MKISISWNDITRQHFHSSGPGGQNVQKVETGVRLIHEPTGIRAQASSERSQHHNLVLAIRLLLSRLRDHFVRLLDQEKGAGGKPRVTFSSQIRSYFLDRHQRVVDHQTGLELPPGPILRGRLDGLLRERIYKERGGDHDRDRRPGPDR